MGLGLGSPLSPNWGGTQRGLVLPLELLSQHCLASHVSCCLFLVFRGCNHISGSDCFLCWLARLSHFLVQYKSLL